MCDYDGENAPENARTWTTALVEARQWRWWRRGGSGPARIHVVRAERDAPSLSTLLLPFDRCSDVAPRGVRRGSRQWLRRVVLDWDGAWRGGHLTALPRMSIAVLGYQLTPALALLQGRATRLLIADDVGLGKTVETALALAELARRGLADRVLVLTPAGLRQQWQTELRDRVRLASAIVDRAALSARRREVPAAISPWEPPGIALVSIDFAKQPAVLAGLAAVSWDVLVVDEAHRCAADSARAAAAHALGRRSRMVMLLSATPHSGDEDAFRKLCALGRLKHEPPVLWVRRGKEARGNRGRRRVRVIRTRPSPEERRLHRALDAYARAVDRHHLRGAALAMVVLRKRALSSPFALRCSLVQRRRALGTPLGGAQTSLPFDDPAEHDAMDAIVPPVLFVAGFSASADEIRTLTELADLARHAEAGWSKAAAIERLLTRTRETAIVFTEYRDTLYALAARLASVVPVATLHGGLDRRARSVALERFRCGGARVLLATDAAAEGLNLQERCRLVVHVEVPWSPLCLEQRAGRIDRIGQTRPPHVWHLLGERGREARVLEALAARVARIEAAGLDLTPAGLPFDWRPAASGAPAAGLVRTCDLDAETDQEARHAIRLRGLLLSLERHSPASASGWRASRAVRWLRLRRPAALPRGVVVLVQRASAARGDCPTLLGIHVAMTRLPPHPPSSWLPAVIRLALEHARLLPANPETTALAARERALLGEVQWQLDSAPLWQPSLFDRRALRAVSAGRELAEESRARHESRLLELSPEGQPPIVVALAALVVR